MTNLPKWAVPEKYEYDLGMQTECFECSTKLKEGQTVFRDTEDADLWKAHGFLHMSNALYCSERCVLAAEAGYGLL